MTILIFKLPILFVFGALKLHNVLDGKNYSEESQEPSFLIY